MNSQEREDEFKRVKICDFGLSQKIDFSSKKAKLEHRLGTIGYMAPEL